MTEATEIIETEAIEKLPATTPATFLSQAIQAGLSIDHLERLMKMQQEWESNQAKKAFLSALSKFQAICPVIEKKKQVTFNQTKYKYADLGEISETIKPAIEACGLSYRWEFDESDNKYTCYCIVSHIDGHNEHSKMTAEKDTSGNKNAIQAIGSARTYLQRYTLIAALGITTADEDNDGRKPEQYPDAEKKQNKKSEPKPEQKTDDKSKGRNYTVEADECMKANDPYQAYIKWWQTLSPDEKANLKKSNFSKAYQEKIKQIQDERKAESDKVNAAPAGNIVIEQLINALSKETFDRDQALIENSIDNVQDNYARRELAFRYQGKLSEIGCETAWGVLPF
jgi:hypothetical protein